MADDDPLQGYTLLMMVGIVGTAWSLMVLYCYVDEGRRRRAAERAPVDADDDIVVAN